MKSRLLLLFLFVCFAAYPQGEVSNWFFGIKAGMRFNPDHSVTVLSTEPDPVIGIDTNEGCSSISDADGNLLFYTDGRNIWDQNHKIMPNADYYSGNGLLGDPSSTQSAIIVPKPGNPNIYYVFTVDEPHHTNASVYPDRFNGTYVDGIFEEMAPFADDGYNNGLNYSVVDLSVTGTNGSVGDVISRNNHVITYNTDPNGEEIKFKCSEKITAVKTKDGEGYWVITHFTDKFLAFKIDAGGVNPTPVITQIDPLVPVSGYLKNARGYLKVSPNGKKLAIAHMTNGGSDGGVYLYDFNSETGVVSNGLYLGLTTGYGLEFSAQSRKLYTIGGGALNQFNLMSSDIPGSKIQLASVADAGLQLGPDRKIYKSNVSTLSTPGISKYLDVINNPELDGAAAGFQPNAVFLVYGLAQFGLPPFIASTFNSSITEKNACHGETTLFETSSNGVIESAVWDFGDGSPVSTAISPGHVYANTGIYTVNLEIVVQGVTITNSKIVEIYPLPEAFPSSLYQCSPTTAVTGVLFNLSQADAQLTNNNSDLRTTFFLTESDALNNNNPLPVAYANTANPQRLYVQVKNVNTECSSITTLDLNVNLTPNPPITLAYCDYDGTEDGLLEFDLTVADIAAAFPSTATIMYYTSLNDTFLEQNPITTPYTNTVSGGQTIYARVENDNKCEGIFTLNLIVHPLPQIKTEDIQYICTNHPGEFITLDAGFITGSAANHTFEWSTGATTPTIMTDETGTYTVTVTNASLCVKTRTITVSYSNSAVISEVVISDLTNNKSVTVLLDGSSIGAYQYSLDLPDGPFQDSNYFENVTPGTHTIYVYDTHGCGIISKDISVLGIPLFFTPNGDGHNDTWDIIGMNSRFYPNSQIYIYDRYGKLLKEIDPTGYGWDGTFNGQLMPSSDYWFAILLEDGRIAKGHFSLKR